MVTRFPYAARHVCLDVAPISLFGLVQRFAAYVVMERLHTRLTF